MKIESVKKGTSLKGGKLIKVTRITAIEKRHLKNYKDSEELEVVTKGDHFDATV